MTRMQELHAEDWYVTGRGSTASVSPKQVTETINVGDHVRIDGDEYKVHGIEVSRGLTDPPVILRYGLVVRP